MSESGNIDRRSRLLPPRLGEVSRIEAVEARVVRRRNGNFPIARLITRYRKRDAARLSLQQPIGLELKHADGVQVLVVGRPK